MRLIGLPGRDPATESWMRRLLEALDMAAGDSTVAHYRHWDTGGEPDVGHEASLIDVSSSDVVVAKSLGTMVVLAAHGARGTRPARAVFIGTPIRHYTDGQVRLIEQLARHTPLLFVQQTDDVTGSYADLEARVGGFRDCTLTEVPGSDHVYADVDALADIIGGWRGA